MTLFAHHLSFDRARSDLGILFTKRGWLHHSPQEAGESGDRGVHGDAHVGHRQAEHQEIAGGPQLPHFEESDHRHRVEEEAQQTLWWEEIKKKHE